MILKLFVNKEIKKFPLFFILLIFTLFLGTVGLSGISVISDQVQAKLQENAKELLTSDIVVSARRDLLINENKTLDLVMRGIPHQSYRLIDIYSMVKLERTAQTKLVEIRSFEKGFPFYGGVQLNQGDFGPEGLFISKDLAELWGVQILDKMKIGEKIFTVKGIVLKDSSQGFRGFSLAPRIYLPLKDVEQTGLLRDGSTGNYAYHYLIPHYSSQQFLDLQKELFKKLPDLAIKVTLPQESSEQTGKVIGYLTDFMSLAALIGLLLSLVGAFYLYQSHLAARLKDFCLFHLYGLKKSQIIMGLIIQFSFVYGLVVFGLLLFIRPLYQLIRPLLSQSLGIDLSSHLDLKILFTYLPFFYGLALAILIPLLLGLLRTPMAQQLKAGKISLGTFHFYDFVSFLFLFWGFSVFLAHSFKTGSFFFGALLIVFIFSSALIKWIQYLLRRYLLNKNLGLIGLEAGIAVRNIIHSGHKLTLSFLSLAMGTTLISFILQLDSLIQKEFILDEKKPSLFIFDIQEEQLAPLLDFSKEHHVRLEGITPMIRARLDRVNGKVFSRTEEKSGLQTREEEGESRMKNRGINLTYREALSSSETLVEGSLFPKEKNHSDRAAYVSLEKNFAKRMGLKLGDKITFDIQGVEMDGVVLNFRDVKWTSFYPNFFVNIEPGFIEEAPKTFLAVLPQEHHDKKREFQRDSVTKFPNISFVDVEELMGKLTSLFEKSRQAIEVISWLSLSIGFVILYGLCHDQVYRRYYDLALMKTLGLTSGPLRKLILIEFGFLFTVALGVGFFLGWLMAVIIGEKIFKLAWSVDWGQIMVPGLLLGLICLVTILISSWRAIQNSPRELLSDS